MLRKLAELNDLDRAGGARKPSGHVGVDAFLENEGGPFELPTQPSRRMLKRLYAHAK